jgi:hypothetical protein
MTSIIRRHRTAGILLGLALALPACSQDDILKVDNPDTIDADDLLTTTGVQATYAGAISELTSQMTGPGSTVIFAGLFTDEAMHGSTPPEVRQFDLRDVQVVNTIPNGFFLGLQRARYRNERAARIIGEVVAPTDKRVGETLAFAAWSYIFMAELYCSAIPVSDPETEELGSPLSTAQVLDLALERLTSAASATEGDARLVNLIAVLRGRALLNKGDFSGAATAVANVPTTYEYQFFHSTATARQNNQIPVSFNAEIYSVPNREGTNGLDFVTANDPRVPTRAGSQADGLSRNDRATPMRIYSKYAGAGDAVTMASGIEARLIEAEALVKTDPTGWLGKLNAARATRPTELLPLVDPGTESARVDLTFRERAFWLYLTAHRLGDLRRLVRQYGRDPESVYPTGAYHKQGLTRGRQASWIIPQFEDNNPNFSRASCDPTKA